MPNLEDLVPTLDLCRKIPEGAFEDSVLVWEVKDIGETALVMRAGTLPPHLRFGRFKTFLYPAPTLAEIMEELRKMRHFPVLYFDAYKFQRWTVEDMCGSVTCDQSNHAAAALKLWMQVKGVE